MVQGIQRAGADHDVAAGGRSSLQRHTKDAGEQPAIRHPNCVAKELATDFAIGRGACGTTDRSQSESFERNHPSRAARRALPDHRRELGRQHCIFDFVVPRAQRPAPAHSHDHYEETIYGDGVLTWTVDRKQIDVGPGRALCIRRSRPGKAAQTAVVCSGLGH